MEHLKIKTEQLQDTSEITGTVENYVCESLKDISKGQRLKIQYSITTVDEEILCNGIISGEIKLECSRCLKLFEFPVMTKISASYSSEDKIIDLGEEVTQLLILGMPSKPLCRESCAGLCCNCGRNLNDDSCSCKKEQLNPQWEKLKKFFK